ncbi:MAG: phage portal protein [Bacilli bacterium]|nr:phage portal protein [Bacilli bacterium]
MAIFNRLKSNREERKNIQRLESTFKLLTGYNAVFTTFNGGLYEMGLTRSCIDKIATQCSKLHPIINGNKNYNNLNILLQNKPNRLMTTQQFLYRLVTILLVENNAYIIPIFENSVTMKIIGFYPARASGSKIVKYNGTDYLVYQIDNKEYAVEYDFAGVLRRHYYKKEYLGESNSAIHSTMDLINTQEQGIKEGIKSGAMIRFLARLGVVQNPESISAEQKRLKDEQLSMENNGGILIFDSKYSDVQKVDSKPFIVDKENMDLIKNNVFDYFHMSEEILQNTASEDQWNLFYEDVIEPIAIQISQVLTNMIIKQVDIAKGLNVVLESTKLQFISNNTKLNVSQQLFDRGILSTNQVMDIWNLPHVSEDEDKRYIRKEYTEVTNLDKEVDDNEQNDGNSESNESESGESSINEDKVGGES